MAYFKVFEKPLDDIVIFRQSTQPGIQADICHARRTQCGDSDEADDDYSSPMPTVMDEADDDGFEDTTRCSMFSALLNLIATLFSKFVFLYLFVSNGKTEAFSFLLDIVVFAYSVYHTPIYVPQSNIYKCGY